MNLRTYTRTVGWKQMNSSKKNTQSLSRTFRAGVLASALTFSLVSLSACAPRVAVRGNIVHPKAVSTIKVGTSTQNDVIRRLGSPSNTSAFGKKTWYYISERTETLAFLAPKVMNRQVIMIQFAKNGVVSSVKTINSTKAASVIPAAGKTPTSGKSLGLFDQLFSNLGRFNNK